MGQAKNRGTFEERRQAAIDSGKPSFYDQREKWRRYRDALRTFGPAGLFRLIKQEGDRATDKQS